MQRILVPKDLAMARELVLLFMLNELLAQLHGDGAVV